MIILLVVSIWLMQHADGASAFAVSHSTETLQSVLDRLQRPVSLVVRQRVPLADFCEILRYSTGIDFPLIQNGDALISPTKWVERPAFELLDDAIKPLGLRWIVAGEGIMVFSDIQAKMFSLSDEDTRKMSLIMKDRGTGEPFYKNRAELHHFDPKARTFFLQGSPARIKEMERTIESLRKETFEQLFDRVYGFETQEYRVYAENTQELENLIGHSIHLSSETQVSNANVREIQLRTLEWRGLDRVLISGLRNEMRLLDDLLDAKACGPYNPQTKEARYCLVSPVLFQQQREQSSKYASHISEILCTMLYSDGGGSKARKDGRYLHLENGDTSGSLVIMVDYPKNLKRAGDLILSVENGPNGKGGKGKVTTR